MFQKDVVFYLGKEKENGFSGVIAEDGFLVAIEIEDGLTSESGHDTLSSLKEQLLASHISNLREFETLIHEKIKEHNLPSNISLAAGFVKENILYVITVGGGSIYLHRENQFGKLIAGEQTASGHIREHDLYLFTTGHFIQTMGGETEVKKIFDHKKPHQIIEDITPQLKGKEDQGIIALFAKFNPKTTEIAEEADVTAEEPLFISNTSLTERASDVVKKLYRKTQQYSEAAGPKKKFTFLAVIIIFFVLLWSVGFGAGRRSDAVLEKRIQSVKQDISQKLSQADQAAFLDVQQALSYISDARNKLDVLKKELGGRKQQEVQAIADLIKQEENKITKKEEKQFTEFFDLAVDNKQAKGSDLYLDDTNLAVLDKEQGIIYDVSITKKSLGKKQFSEVKGAQKVARYADDLFFYRSDGFYKISSDGKLTKIIEKDADWGTIVDFWIYNGNIYVLDTGKNMIYKYMVGENGYSGKTAYFKGGASGLTGANSLAIDSSVYVGYSDHVFKFTAGVQDEFKTSFPHSDLHITKVFTAKDLEKVYVWDKSAGSVYVLGKNGTYERELTTSVVKQADDFVVKDKNAYLLSGQKIYSMSVE